MYVSRRNCLKTISIGSIAALSNNYFIDRATAATPVSFIGSNSGYTIAEFQLFMKWFGHVPNFAGFMFALSSTGATLASSIKSICALGAGMSQLGSQVIWSVPFPARMQLEKVIAGQYDALYTGLFQSILAASPASAAPIYVRLPWEFNINDGVWVNSAVDATGAPSPAKFVAAWTRLAVLARNVSARFNRIWCSGTTTRQIDPLACWPGAQYVEVVSQDFYMTAAHVSAGSTGWYMNEARGLKWGTSFAAAQNKPFALTELGMDSDIFAGDLGLVALWLQGLGSKLHHVCWWDRAPGMNCKISDGSHPVLGAKFKQAFG